MSVAEQCDDGEFRFIANHLPVFLWRISADFKCDWVNQAWIDFTGVPADQQLRFGWLELVHPNDRDRVAEAFDAAFTQKSPVTIQFRLRRKDGTYRWVIDSGVPIIRDGLFDGFAGSGFEKGEPVQA